MKEGIFLGHLIIFLELIGLESNFYRLFAYRRKIKRFAQNPSVSVVKLNTNRDYSRNNILINISWCYNTAPLKEGSSSKLKIGKTQGTAPSSSLLIPTWHHP